MTLHWISCHIEWHVKQLKNKSTHQLIDVWVQGNDSMEKKNRQTTQLIYIYSKLMGVFFMSPDREELFLLPDICDPAVNLHLPARTSQDEFEINGR